jgi:hypothetical protein
MPLPPTRLAALALAGALLAAPALADEEGFDHYDAVPSETLDEAVANFREYNAKLAEVMAKDDLADADMERIHELTYTLEEALAKIAETVRGLPVTLENLHLASEARDTAKVRGVGQVYLEDAQAVVK